MIVIITTLQSRFLLYNATHDLEELWTIPINYATADDPDFTDTSAELWLTGRYRTRATYLNPDSWVIFNKQETGKVWKKCNTFIAG